MSLLRTGDNPSVNVTKWEKVGDCGIVIRPAQKPVILT